MTRVLVLCDDYWHPGETIRDGLEPLGANGWTFDIVDDASAWSPELMSSYPVTVLAKADNVTAEDRSSWADEAMQQAFIRYVEGGAGLLVLHSGTCYAERPALRALLGGAFDHHPKQCPVSVEAVDDGHPLCDGFEPFTAIDEHYHMLLDDAAADVFLTATSEHGSQPGGWTRTLGQGRVCVLTPGHNLDVFLQPGMQTLLENALRWCLG